MSNPATAGDLRFRVRFDKKAKGDATFGATDGAWKAQFTRWADIRPMRGGEGIQAQRLEGTQPLLIIVRYDAQTLQINSDWRAVEMKKGAPFRYYALKTAEDMERNKAFVTMIAEEGAADGGTK